MQVSYFPEGIHQTTPTQNVPIEWVLTQIQNGTYERQITKLRSEANPEKQITIKKGLPYFTASGTFSERKAEKLLKHSGLLQLDFDKVPNPENLKRLVSAEPFILACFISPSANGVKALARIAPNIEAHKTAFFCLYSYFLKKIGISIDTKAKDVSRACFVSFDRQIFTNYQAEIFIPSEYSELNPNSIRTQSEYSELNPNLRNLPLSTSELFEKIRKGFEQKHRCFFAHGNRNNYIFRLACVCNRYGIPEHEALAELVKFASRDFTAKEIKTSVRSAYKNTHEFGKYELKNPQNAFEGFSTFPKVNGLNQTKLIRTKNVTKV